MDALRMTAVGLDYPGRPGVLDGVDLSIPRGGVLVVRGRSGSGKSSLLGVASGLLAPTRGSVTVGGETLDARDPAQRTRVRARHVGLVLQHLHLLGELTLEQNVALPLRLAGVPRAGQRTRATGLLASFGLGELASRRPAQCSGGEQQRAAIARALALRPTLLVVDEPTSALDEDNARTVVAALATARAEGAAVLVASHDDLLLGLGPAARMADGRLVLA